MNTSRKDRNDKVIAGYVREARILKLMDRMYNGETLNTDQFDTIFNYVRKKGHPSRTQEEWRVPEWENGEIIRYNKEIRERPGYRYLGMFATMEGNEMVLKYGDTRMCRMKQRIRYKTGEIIEH